MPVFRSVQSRAVSSPESLYRAVYQLSVKYRILQETPLDLSNASR
jgi:hypothetical protein